MDMNNISDKRTESAPARQSHTPLPCWQRPSVSGFPRISGSNRKWYMMLLGWTIVVGVALGAGLNHSRCSVVADRLSVRTGSADVYVDSTGSVASFRSVVLQSEIVNSMPRSFRNVQKNEILNSEYLRPVAQILIEADRPLRVLQIGDSHVAGKVFPGELEQTLEHYLGRAAEPDSGRGVWFDYVARNGATNQTLMTTAYMERFAAKRPDLIILSLGTNEAHSMRYSAKQHRQDLTAFLDRLKDQCPDAVVLMTTPPGDYLPYSYVTRTPSKGRQVRRGRRPNPMSAKCAAFLVQMGSEQQMPVWDMYSIFGGAEAAQRNWVASHYMRPDKVHFVPEGYKLQGQILGEALVNSLLQFKFSN